MLIADGSNHRVSVWTRPTRGSTAWAFQTTFGVFGTAVNQFQKPRGVALSTDGLTAWVADEKDPRESSTMRPSQVSIWTRPDAASTAWTFQTAFGTPGSGPGQFLDTLGIAAAPNGLTVWVADPGNNRISVWTRPDAASTVWSNVTTFGTVGSGASQLKDPVGVAVSSDTRTAWVADNGNQRISVWIRPDAASTAWTNQTTFGSLGNKPDQFTDPRGVAVSPDGLRAWIVDGGAAPLPLYGNDRVAVWSRPNTGSTSWSLVTTFGSIGSGPDEFSSPQDLAVAADGRTVYVTQNGGGDVTFVKIWDLACP
ncbi:MAG: hypothetical protein ACKOWF_17970 [Chloroflexota bacterium]